MSIENLYFFHGSLCTLTQNCIANFERFKNNIITPPAKFDNVPENAIPTAKPAAPSNATNEVISIPNWVTPVTNTKILKAMVVKLVKKVTSPSSI